MPRRETLLACHNTSKASCADPLSGILARGWTAVLFDLYAVIGVTDQTSQQPEQHADHEDDSILHAGEIPAKDVDQCDHTTNYTHTEPPEDPMMNPKMNVHNPPLHPP